MNPVESLTRFLGRCTLMGMAGAFGVLASLAASAQGKPNILVIFGDDVGQTNISAYTHGLVGYKTPNIDRIAKEGMMFTDYYAENSCTAGRSTFITGQTRLRTGLSKVGMPGAPVGLQNARHHDRAGAQAARLRDRPVRQEPPGDRDEYPADQSRLRRVLRQPLPPERRGRTRTARTGRRTIRTSSRSQPARRAAHASPTARSRTPAR